MTADWRDYQERAAALFRAIGMDAETDATVQGVRTKHNIDVLVKSHHGGFDVTWLVECKYWKTAVSKMHVIALRGIVADVGVDRGIIVCEAGFQSGAIEAANLTNVRVMSLAEIRIQASRDISALRLRELYDRMEDCRTRYWEIPKSHRIHHGLRQDVGQFGYSGGQTIDACKEILSHALRGSYPLRGDSLQSYVTFGKDKQFASAEEVIKTIEPLVSELEAKLTMAEKKLAARLRP